MQLLIFPGYHSPKLTDSFLHSMLQVVTPDQYWVVPMWTYPVALPWLLTHPQKPQLDQSLQIVAFSAGVVAAYPLILGWQHLGGRSTLIAMDGWGMPLWGNLTIYRISHDRWTHDTTYLPSPAESTGYFYAEPTVEHLELWQSPDQIQGMGAMGTTAASMTMREFIAAALMKSIY